MTTAITIGSFVGYRSLVTGDVRLTVDVPKEFAREALDALSDAIGQQVSVARIETAAGKALLTGNATPAVEVASQPTNSKLDSGAAKPRTLWRKTPRWQQAAIRCNEPKFLEFLHLGYNDIIHDSDAAQAVRDICGVHSRAELGNNKDGTPINPRAATRWDRLDVRYRRWAGLETEPRG